MQPFGKVETGRCGLKWPSAIFKGSGDAYLCVCVGKASIMPFEARENINGIRHGTSLTSHVRSGSLGRDIL